MKTVYLPKLFQPFQCLDLIRLGKNNDGGYLVNSLDIYKSNRLISFGIGEDSSFETDFRQKKNVDVTSYDESVDSLPNNILHIKENVNSKNIEMILSDNDYTFLKCDIDGGEYEILPHLIKNSHRLTGAVIEFHSILNSKNFNDIANFIAKFELRLVHAHINNYMYFITDDGFIPDVIELSFSSSRENTVFNENVTLPHVLDMPNNPNDDELKITFM